jgi:urea transport system permease protein
MLTQALFRALDKKAIWLVWHLVFAVAILVPMANLLIPEGSSLHLPTYLVSLMGKYLNYAILALALDLVWGYCGILSLGHGAFFALGGYAMGMYLMRQIGSARRLCQPGAARFHGVPQLEGTALVLAGFDNFWFALADGGSGPRAPGFRLRFFAFRSRVTGVYLSIMTQAMTFALLLAFFRNDMGFGGNNGLTDFKDILGAPSRLHHPRVALFAASAITLALAVSSVR